MWYTRCNESVINIPGSGGDWGIPPLFWPKNTDFVIFMQFLAIFPKLVIKTNLEKYFYNIDINLKFH